MPNYFFDTSAVSKRYRTETGSMRVDALLSTAGSTFNISRLAAVELHSTLAKKVRIGQLTQAEFEKLTRRFRSDLKAKRWRVMRVTIHQFESAVRLIRKVGLTRNLRTLDALQLAVALSLNDPVQPIDFVCADQALCAIAAAEGLVVINPEVP